MNQPLIVVATITADTHQLHLVEKALREAVRDVRHEPGCERYELHRDIVDPTCFVMLEQWRDEASIAQHSRAPAFLTLAKVLEGRATLSVTKLTRLV